MWHFDLSTVVEIPLYACKTSRLARWFLPFYIRQSSDKDICHPAPKLISHSPHYFPRKHEKVFSPSSIHITRRGSTFIRAEDPRHWALERLDASLSRQFSLSMTATRGEDETFYALFGTQQFIRPNLRSTPSSSNFMLSRAHDRGKKTKSAESSWWIEVTIT